MVGVTQLVRENLLLKEYCVVTLGAVRCLLSVLESFSFFFFSCFVRKIFEK